LLQAVLSTSIAVAASATTASSTYPMQSIFTFDLVGMSVKANEVYLPKLYENYGRPTHLALPFVPKGTTLRENPLTMDNIRKLYSPHTNMNIYWYGQGKGLRLVETSDEFAELKRAWLTAIVENPAAYLSVRTDVFLSLMGLRATPLAPYYCVGG